MSRRLGPHRVGGCLLAPIVIALAACGGPTRTATLNDSTQVSGERVALALQQQLAKQDVRNAAVSCTKTIIVYVGPALSCQLSGAGPNGTVKFKFATLGGKIDLSSVRAS